MTVRGPLVTSLGHAGLRVETPDLKLLCDPWVSPGGAFLGSWFPFPDNSRLRSAPGLLDADWVAVSHEHLDHMDLGFLAGLPDGVRVVIPRYPASTCRDRLTAAGVRHVVEVEAWRRLPLNTRGDWLTVIPEQSPMCHDAAFLVVTDGVSVLHTNDARLSLAQARRAMAEVGGPLDLMAVQMSGASWHPICYDYPSEVVAKICADKRSNKFKAVTRLVRGVKPRLVLPYAGPPCFLDPTLAHHNAQIPAPGIFPDQAQATAWLRERIPGQETLFMLPGDSVQLASSSSYAVTRDAHWEGFAFDDPLAVADHLEVYKASRAQEIADVWAAHPDPPSGSGLAERFAEHFGRLGRMNRYFLDRIAMTVRFDIGGEDGGVWDVQLGPERTVVDLDPKDRTNDAVQYKLTMEARWLDAVLRGEVRWEDLFLSLRFRSWRCPDVYNDYLVGLLKHADEEALQAVQDYETERDPDDTVTLRSGDRAFEVTRYCPHAGEDLTEGAVIEDTAEGPVLRCLAHNFGFSLTTGECLNARCDAIKVATAI